MFQASTCRFATAAGSAAEAQAYPQAGRTAESAARHRQNHRVACVGDIRRGHNAIDDVRGSNRGDEHSCGVLLLP